MCHMTISTCTLPNLEVSFTHEHLSHSLVLCQRRNYSSSLWGGGGSGGGREGEKEREEEKAHLFHSGDESFTNVIVEHVYLTKCVLPNECFSV